MKLILHVIFIVLITYYRPDEEVTEASSLAKVVFVLLRA